MLQNCIKGMVKAGAVVSKMLDSPEKIKGDPSKLQITFPPQYEKWSQPHRIHKLPHQHDEVRPYQT